MQIDTSFLPWVASPAAYDKAVAVVKDRLGSFESIANALYEHTGNRVTGNTIRNWFTTRKIPVEFAAAISDLTDGDVMVTDFFPWLPLYV